MGRPNLRLNRKFPRLVRLLRGTCGEFAELVARGVLEHMWEVGYDCGDDHLGDAIAVADAARWPLDPDVLARALAQAGGPGDKGFIEEIEGREGHWRIHDLYDHAPEYVRKRMDRESARRARGQTLAEVRSRAAKVAADARWSVLKAVSREGGTDASRCDADASRCDAADGSHMRPDATGESIQEVDAIRVRTDASWMPRGTTPAPTPAPAPMEGWPAGQPSRARTRETIGNAMGEDQLEKLRIEVASRVGVVPEDFPVSLARDEKKRQETAREIGKQLERLGYAAVLQACGEVVADAKLKGVRIESLAYFPGWLATVKRPAVH
jgi:hypothetical protein